MPATSKKKPNCKKGTPCGYTCISQGKACGKKVNKEQSAQLSDIVKELDTPLAIKAKPQKKLDTPLATKAKPQPAKLSNKDTPLTAEVTEKLQQNLNKEEYEKLKAKSEEDLVKIFKNEYYGLSELKLNALMKDGLTESEAIAVSAYLGPQYGQINEASHNPEKYAKQNTTNNFTLRIITNELIDTGVAKLPVIKSAKDFNDQLEKGLSKDSAGLPKEYERYIAGTPLTHGVDLPIDVVNQLKTLKPGQKYKFNKNLSTGYTPGGSKYFKETNVHFIIEPKLDGTGQGKLVDKYKSYYVEQEVLYPRTAEFEVQKVEIISQQDIVEINKLIDKPTISQTIKSLETSRFKDLQYIKTTLKLLKATKDEKEQKSLLEGLVNPTTSFRVYLKEL